MQYDKKALPCFTEWKLMGKRDYDFSLEPGNCTHGFKEKISRLEFEDYINNKF